MNYSYNFNTYIRFTLSLLILCLFSFVNLKAQAVTQNELSKLQKGEIITNSLTPRLKGNLKGAEAKILIQAPPEKVWNILDNQENLPQIVPRFKKVEILEKTNDHQKVKVAIKVCRFLPLFKYTMLLDTKEKYRRVKFSKIDGCFKQLYGTYELERHPQGTILSYKMFIDTGFYVPNFVCSNGLNSDLPDVLSAIKVRAENTQ